MRFLPTIDLWDPAMGEAVRTGQLKLQVGQWVRCGSDNLSRFVKTDGRSIHAVHPEGARGVSSKRFKHIARLWRPLPNKPDDSSKRNKKVA